MTSYYADDPGYTHRPDYRRCVSRRLQRFHALRPLLELRFAMYVERIRMSLAALGMFAVLLLFWYA